MPWTVRPANNRVKFLAMPAIMTPMKNNANEVMITGIRPKIWLKEAKLGWKTVDDSKKDVPAQKASSAEPWSFLAMMGKATLRDVPSKATMSVSTASAAKARRKLLVTTKSGASSCSLPALCEDTEIEDEVAWDCGCCSVGSPSPGKGSSVTAMVRTKPWAGRTEEGTKPIAKKDN